MTDQERLDNLTAAAQEERRVEEPCFAFDGRDGEYLEEAVCPECQCQSCIEVRNHLKDPDEVHRITNP
jgi:hypothetical protein